MVAPHTGAWIETLLNVLNNAAVPVSRLTQARGLKRDLESDDIKLKRKCRASHRRVD